jgi:3-isopropylmalate/(R)-2-methylmalate dehydratase small subunit
MPEPFRRLTAIAAPLPLVNVDTDMIYPGGRMTTLAKGAQAGNAFRRLRFVDDTDQENPDFILNREPWRQARILVAGDNFGCGSSREMAVWTLYEWGLRCVIAPSFGDIFYANACINGLLPVRVSVAQADQLMARIADPATCEVSVDLEAMTVRAGELEFGFEMDERRRTGLLEGLDEIGMTLRRKAAIADFVRRYGEQAPWTVPASGA